MTSCWLRPSTASTPSSSRSSPTSKTKRWRTSPPATSTPIGAWTVLAALAHNLLRWTQLLGLPDTTIRAARTLRRRLLSIPGRLTRHARGWTLHLPARWPRHGDYINALNRIRALPAAARQHATLTDDQSPPPARPGANTAAHERPPTLPRKSQRPPTTAHRNSRRPRAPPPRSGPPDSRH